MTLTLPETMLFALLRSALWQESAVTVPFVTATDSDWVSCMRLAAHQGVQAVAFDGLTTLPRNLQPPRPLKIAWAAGTAAIAQQHVRYLGTLARLVRFFATHGINVMLLKGPGLAADYPVPAHRESGDLDIWLFGRYAEGNRLIAAQGISVELHGSKHSYFRFEGIPVENHRTFLNVKDFRMDRILEPVLNHAISAGDSRFFRLPDDSLLALPPAMFNMIFLARHMCTHFANRLVLRHLCDWVCFLRAHHGHYDAGAFRALLSKVRLLAPMEAFTALSINYLGLPAGFSPFLQADQQEVAPEGTTAQGIRRMIPPKYNPLLVPEVLQERILTDILRPAAVCLPEDHSSLDIIAFKWRRLIRDRWKYRLVHDQTFARRLWWSMVIHVLHPGILLKLK